jgi:site-specific DNA recombinase
MRSTLPPLTVDTLHVRPWPDPVIDAVGHDPRSTYVERFWLGVLGPASIQFEPMTKRTAIYCRVSLDRDEDSASPDRQEALCRALIKSKGWATADVFVDRDRSAYKKVARPQFEAMMTGLAAGEFDAIAVWKLDRLTRRFTDTGAILEALTARDAVLLSHTEQIDTSTPMGQALVGVLVAEQESRNTSIRVSSAFKADADMGKAHPGGSRCFGYTRTNEVIPAEAEIADEMVRRFLAGESLRQLAFDLNARSVTTSQGKQWYSSTLRQWLRSPRLAGLRTHRGELHKGTWEPIIDEDTYLKLADAFERNRQSSIRRSEAAHLLTGLVFCGRCGGPLKTMGFVMRNGRTFPRYQCVKQPGHPNCGGTAASKRALDAVVVEEAVAALSRGTYNSSRSSESQASLIRQRIDDDESSLAQLARDRYFDRTINPADYRTVRQDLTERIASNEALLTQLVQSRRPLDLPTTPTALLSWFDTATVPQQRKALRLAVKRVTLNPAARRGGNQFDRSRVLIDLADSFAQKPS